MEVDDIFEKLLTSERMEQIADSIASRTVDKILRMRTLSDTQEDEDTENNATTIKYTKNEKSSKRNVQLNEDDSNGLKLKYNSFTESYSTVKVQNKVVVNDKPKTKKKNKSAAIAIQSKHVLRNNNESLENDSKYDKSRKDDTSNKAVDYDDEQSSRDENHVGSSESDYSNKNVEEKSTKGIIGYMVTEKGPTWYLRKDGDEMKGSNKEYKSLQVTKVPKRYNSIETKNRFDDKVEGSPEYERSFSNKRASMRVQSNETPVDDVYQGVSISKAYVYEKSRLDESLSDDEN